MAIGTTTALLLAAGGGASYLGARGAARAQNRATSAANQAEAQRMDLSREMFDEGRPYREALQRAGLATLPGVLADANREPGTGELFQTGLRRGTQAIFQELAPYGLTDSSTASRGIGDFAEGLMSSDMADIRNRRMALLGLPQDQTAAGVNLMGQAGQIAQGRIGLMANDPYAGLYGDVAGTASTLGFLGMMRGFNGGGMGGGTPFNPYTGGNSYY